MAIYFNFCEFNKTDESFNYWRSISKNSRFKKKEAKKIMNVSPHCVKSPIYVPYNWTFNILHHPDFNYREKHERHSWVVCIISTFVNSKMSKEVKKIIDEFIGSWCWHGPFLRGRRKVASGKLHHLPRIRYIYHLDEKYGKCFQSWRHHSSFPKLCKIFFPYINFPHILRPSIGLDLYHNDQSINGPNYLCLHSLAWEEETGIKTTSFRNLLVYLWSFIKTKFKLWSGYKCYSHSGRYMVGICGDYDSLLYWRFDSFYDFTGQYFAGE